MEARFLNIALGGWLFLSAFAWPHGEAQHLNTWITGALVVVFAALAVRWPAARYLNALGALWLFVSAFALPGTALATLWNNTLVALAVFVVSLIPSPDEPPLPLRRVARQQQG